MSLITKFVLAAESVTVINAVWLLPRVAALEEIVTVGESVLTASAREPAATLTLPAASEKLPTGTEMLAAPVKPAVGVKVLVKTVLAPLAASAPSVPPVTVMSPIAKSVEASESVKVMVAVPPATTLETFALIVAVGATVSTAKESVPVGATPGAALSLPATSVKAPWPTVTTALPLKLAAGVKVVVKTVPAPVRAPIEPPETATSAAVKPPAAMASERVKVSCVVWPVRRVEPALEAMETVGVTVSMVIGARDPARFWLPLMSVKAAAATEMLATPLKLAAGVKTAV